MSFEESIVEKLEKIGKIGLVEFGALFLPSPPVKVWEEEYEENCEDEEDEEE